MSRAREPFTMLSNRFIDAEMRGELTERQAKLCRFIARHANEKRREARLTLSQIAAGVGWERSLDTLLRELKGLAPVWIAFESTQCQRGPYVIRLTGLAVGREGEDAPPDVRTAGRPTSAQPPHHFRKNLRTRLAVTSSKSAARAESNLRTIPPTPLLPLTSTRVVR